MLRCRSLSSRAPIHLACVFSTLLLTAATAIAGDAAPLPTGPSAVSADVHWVGPCANRRALERAMHARGAQLEQPGANVPSTGRDRFTVDVSVRSLKGSHPYAGRIEIQGTSGTHDVRELEADRCEELHSVIAWVLVVLARGPRGVNENDRASDVTTAPVKGPYPSSPVPAAASEPSVATAAGASALARGDIPSKVQLAYGSVMPKAKPRFALGAQLLGSWLFLRNPAWGPAVFFEHRPWLTRPFAARVTVLTITNDAVNSGSSIGVAVRRTAARFGASLRLPQMPFALSSGLEAGLVSARGSGQVLSHESRSRWGAWFAGIVLDLPLLHERLRLEAGADLSVSPFRYAFRTSSERTIIESKPLELRAAVGLKSSF